VEEAGKLTENAGNAACESHNLFSRAPQNFVAWYNVFSRAQFPLEKCARRW
jgi:hypothetical protein